MTSNLLIITKAEQAPLIQTLINFKNIFMIIIVIRDTPFFGYKVVQSATVKNGIAGYCTL